MARALELGRSLQGTVHHVPSRASSTPSTGFKSNRGGWGSSDLAPSSTMKPAGTVLLLGLLALRAELQTAPREKPGVCPSSAPGVLDPCFFPCSSDYSCPGSQKCCLIPCGQACLDPLPGPRDICRLPPDPGPCLAAVPRWFYHWPSGRCRKFEYGSCSGNANNFETKHKCLWACAGHARWAACPEPQGVGPCVELCRADGACGEGEKCCSNGCGHQCMRVTGGPR
ncbi:PREDICTED: eppin-like [Crocodylus porosus]|uniref:eppin-like n=1 Tax=Crocodylus porosus TaxID=8502 RepID=UPI00093CCC45|nr:PREDICTED: eppin-like [Crocodylus porosus]